MTSIQEREYLRELARRQMEIASLPIMGERIAKWRKLNNGELYEPLVSVEYNGYYDEFFPEIKCLSPISRELEMQMIKNITYHEQLNDDRVIPTHISVPVQNSIIPFGIEEERIYARNEGGKKSMGYSVKHPINELEQDYHILGDTNYSVDINLNNALRHKSEVEELIGDIMPVKIEFSSFYFCLGGVLNSLMGMENMMLSLYECPELIHKMMDTLTNDYLTYMDKIEEGGAILLNNDSSHLGQGSWGYTDDLPSAKELNRKVTFGDVWGYTNFQETTGISVKMFDDFFFSYMERITNRFGLLSYGCCEPIDMLWDSCLSRLSNLRKLSISPWCKGESIAEKIRGKKIVYHCKPSANYVSSDASFDDKAFEMHMAENVKTAAGCPVEVTFREELTLKGEPWRMKKAVDITKEQFQKHWK
jgi:hypothetical protein